MTEKKAGKIKLVFLDVDGVMTDGRITMDAQGKETKSFCVKDGLGLRMLMSGGVDVVIVTGRSSQVVEHRANDLGIEEVYQGVTDKNLLCRQIIKDRGLMKQEVCCIGDDLADLPMFSEAGLCIAVADAVKEVREAADFITRSKGGLGAVREACEWLLKCQGKWQTALAPFAGE
ncbi:MAG: HAD hydrolase family protein [Deltaproteobacteria bacterium]|nr:HAD hydrolase family protein [Deltaproteobacteria bacterium]